MGKIETALISVSDKQGIVEFSRALAAMGVELVSTGGTAALLRDSNIPVKDVAELTGFPEMMDGRVKTLHPKIHGGILALRDNPEHVAKMKEHGIKPIDLVVVNLYPFEATVARGAAFDEIVENIDIGGPSMVRAAAKNHQHVGVVVDPADYDSIVAEMRANHGALLPATHFRLFCKAFQHTSNYDGAISNYFSSLDQDKKPQRWGQTVNIQVSKLQDMRYGENPHQSAAFYGTTGDAGPSISRAKQFQGKELSFNNILDADAALSTVLEFADIATVAIKHNNPCGVALSNKSLVDSFRKAKACDPVSIFGGVLAFNRPVDEETALELKDIFLEIVIAPSFTPEAKAVLSSAKRLLNIRLLELDMSQPQTGGYDLRRVRGGMLIQDWDTGKDRRARLQSRHRTQTDGRRISRSRFRLAGLPSCKIQHHRVRIARPSARRRRRPDEPHRFDQDRRAAGGDSRSRPERLRGRFGRFLPVPRRPRCSRRWRRQVDYPTGRLDQRRRSHRCRQ